MRCIYLKIYVLSPAYPLDNSHSALTIHQNIQPIATRVYWYVDIASSDRGFYKSIVTTSLIVIAISHDNFSLCLPTVQQCNIFDITYYNCAVLNFGGRRIS
jgi:hypothetical protein